MAKALSLDLRRRVVNAIATGMSRRQAAERFGVSAASAIRWQKQFSDTGTIQSDKQGGDRRSKHIDYSGCRSMRIERQPATLE